MFKKASAALLVLLLCAGLLAGCGRTDGTKAALTINGETVSTGTANTFIRYQQSVAYAQMVQWQLITEGSQYWDMIQDQESGQTYGEYFKDAVKTDLINMVLLRQHSADYGISLTDEENSAITSAAAQFIKDNGSVAKWIGADQASVENLLSLYTYQAKMYNPMVADVDTEVSDEEAAQSTIIYFRLPLTKPDDYDGTDEAYKEEARTQMQTLLEQAKAEVMTGAEGSEEGSEEEASVSDTISNNVTQYSTLASEINSSIYVTSYSYGEDGGSLDEAVKEAVKDLKDGEFFNGVVDTESYLYLVKMEAVFDPDATETKKKSIANDRQEQAYTDMLNTWTEESTITEESGWNQIKVSDKENYVKKS